MRDLLRRIEKLEDRFGTAACICGGPGLAIMFVGDPEPEPLPDCPVHGEQERTIVAIQRYNAELPVEPVARTGRVLPDGCVEVLLPGPEGVCAE